MIISENDLNYFKINSFYKIQFILLFSRQGKLRLQKWYVAQPDKSKKKYTRELIATILSRKPKMSSFLENKLLFIKNNNIIICK